MIFTLFLGVQIFERALHYKIKKEAKT